MDGRIAGRARAVKLVASPIMCNSCVRSALAVAAMPFAPTPQGLWVAAIVFGGGLAVMGVASGLLVFTLAGFSTGVLVGIYRLSGDVMQVFGPMAIGPILDAFGFEVSFLLMAGFGLVSLLSLVIRPGKRG
ncbi:MAG TPA: hypothetical protein VFH48_45210 [Chloroflexota bacterium]|nr:hypothetical protein [Chloroflexota bacterium]